VIHILKEANHAEIVASPSRGFDVRRDTKRWKPLRVDRTGSPEQRSFR